MTPTTDSPKSLSRTRRFVAVTAGAALGIASTFAVASAQDGTPTFDCPPTEADLLFAAESARRLEAERPDLFVDSPRARYGDLRLAAEWARRLAILDPSRAACGGR